MDGAGRHTVERVGQLLEHPRLRLAVDRTEQVGRGQFGELVLETENEPLERCVAGEDGSLAASRILLRQLVEELAQKL